MIYAVGETVFDIIFQDYHPQAARPGGSAFNAIISLGRLGIPSSFISEVGNDKIGKMIKEFLQENGVKNDYVEMFEDGKSALSLAFLNASSDAEYEFYKDYPNQRLKGDPPAFAAEDYLLFGSFYGLNPVLRPQMKKILEEAGNRGTLVYYDPNFRDSHLAQLSKLRGIIEENFRLADIVRASDEDMRNIYGVTSAEEAWKIISPFCQYFIYTANAHGVDLFSQCCRMHIDVDRIDPVSTIGAGDTFNAGILYGLYRRKVSRNSLFEQGKEHWKEILETAALFSREVCLSFDNYIPVAFAEKFKASSPD